MRKLNTINNKKGISLVFVVLVMMVLSILSVALFTLFTSNMRQAQRQENAIRAHYLAISGVDVTFAALMQGDTSDRLVNTYFNEPINITVDPISDSFEMDAGDVDVVVSTYIEDGNRWVLITSVGTLNDGSNSSQTIEMKFRVEYPEIQIWN